MPSTLIGAPTTVGGHLVITLKHPSGRVYSPRFRNVAPAGYADLPTYQAACQAAAIAAADATIPIGPNATNHLSSLR